MPTLLFKTDCLFILSGDAGEVALQSEAKDSTGGGVARKSTRMWAQQSGYAPEKIFNKVSGLLVE